MLGNDRDGARIYALSRLTVAFIWLYHGLVPKLLAADPDEAALLRAAGLAPQHVTTLIHAIGLAEIVFGVALLAAWRARWLFGITILLMIAALALVAVGSPGYLTRAFNPVTLNIATIALSVIGLLSGKRMRDATRTPGPFGDKV